MSTMSETPDGGRLPEAIEQLFNDELGTIACWSVPEQAEQIRAAFRRVYVEGASQERARRKSLEDLLKRIYDDAAEAHWRRLILDAVCPLSPVTETDIAWAKAALAARTPPTPEAR